jgi:hypothetical protein
MLSAADRDRVMGHLEYPTDDYYTAAVFGACKNLERFGGTIAETRIIGYLNDLDALRVKIASSASNSTLIQADVLKWSDTKSRSSGFENEYERLKRLLYAAFKLSPYTGAGGASGSGNSLSRG